MKARKKFLTKESWGEIKEFLTAKVPTSSIKRLTGRSDMTIGRIRTSESFEEYQKLTHDQNEKYRLSVEAKKSAMTPSQAASIVASASKQVEDKCSCCDKCEEVKEVSVVGGNNDALERIEKHLAAIASAFAGSRRASDGFFARVTPRHMSNGLNR